MSNDFFPGLIYDLDTTECIMGVVNGWSSENIGFPSDFYNTFGIFIQAFRYPSDRTLSQRYQMLIDTIHAKIWTREAYYDDTDQTVKFTDWSSSS